jgi:tetratricopeptide (TPR) repeat protein
MSQHAKARTAAVASCAAVMGVLPSVCMGLFGPGSCAPGFAASATAPSDWERQVNLLDRQMQQLIAQDQYDQAIAPAEQALQLTEQYAGAEDLRTAFRLNDLGLLYKATGRYEQAVPLLRRALAIEEKEFGAEDPETAKVLIGLALALKGMGRYDQALPLVQQALAIDEKARVAEDPITVEDLNNLGVLYKSMSRYDQALPLYQRASYQGEGTWGWRSADSRYPKSLSGVVSGHGTHRSSATAR